MAKHGRGLICLALTQEKVKKLKLPLMSLVNKSRTNHLQFLLKQKKEFQQVYLLKIGLRQLKWRLKIILAARTSFHRPFFPLVSKTGGVLVRAGHTEASVDISKLAKLNPSSVICEVMNEDGTMARYKDLVPFSKKHNLKIAKMKT